MAATVKSIAFVAGKSGGHIIPCISIMHQHYPAHAALFFTTDAMLDITIMQQNASHVTHIPLPLNISYKNAWYALPRLMWRLLISFCISIRTLAKTKPERIVTTGGLIALPVCLGAYFLGIPIDIYELNAIPGKTTTLLSNIATHIYVCFKQTASSFLHTTCSVTPYPIRYNPDATYDTHAIRASYGLQPNILTLLVLGGSQGSIGLNSALKNALQHRMQPLQIIHQTGSIDTTDWVEWYAKQGIKAHVYAYEHNLAPLLAAADIVLCRAGAGTLFEVAFFNKPCIIVPLEGLGDNHQVANAYAMQQQKADCFVLKQNDIQKNAHLLIQQVEHFNMYSVLRPEEIKSM